MIKVNCEYTIIEQNIVDGKIIIIPDDSSNIVEKAMATAFKMVMDEQNKIVIKNKTSIDNEMSKILSSIGKEK